MTETETDAAKWAPIERYAGLVAELDGVLGDREMEVLLQAGARLVRLSYPDVFRTVQI